MAVRQKKTPNFKVRATRGLCLGFVDDAGSAPHRTYSAQAAYNVERSAGRLNTSRIPLNVWVVGFLRFTTGPYVNLGHVYFIKSLGNGKYEIRDSEVASGARGIYHNLDELLAWFGAYRPVYAGWSMQCDGAVYAENYTPIIPKRSAPTRKAAKGTAKVLTAGLNVRNAPSTSAAIVARYTKGNTFKYDSYIVANGFVWLSYISQSNVRRYVAEGPNDGNNNTVYVSGGV